MLAAACNCHSTSLRCHDSPFLAQCSSVAALSWLLATRYHTLAHLTAKCCSVVQTSFLDCSCALPEVLFTT